MLAVKDVFMVMTAELLDALRRYRLAESPRVDELTQRAGKEALDPETLLQTLVKEGDLSAFQAEMLLKGRGRELVLGSYVLLDRLGQGGMGTVYKARQWKLGRTVALKLIRQERLTDETTISRFRREIRAGAKLNHPNIIRVYDADEVDGVHFFTMEYIQGVDLARDVRECGPLPPRIACDYVRQAALGLQHAFECGMVHRDIKPSNLLLVMPRTGQVSAAPIVKILDMGLARWQATAEGDSAGSITSTGMIMGSPDYLAPEQSRDSRSVDIRADLYGLGASLYFLLTGRVPFPASSVGEKLVKHQLEEPTPLEMFCPDVPPRVSAIVRKLMAKKPADRYQTPADLIAALADPELLQGDERAWQGERLSRPEPLSGEVTKALGHERIRHAPPLTDSELPTSETQTTPLVAEFRQRRAERQAAQRKLLFVVAAALPLVAGIVALVWFVAGGNEHPTRPVGGAPGPLKPVPAKSAAARATAPAPADSELQARKRREATAERELPALETQFRAPDVTFSAFAQELAAFKAKHGGTAAAIQAAGMLMKLPSPLDQLSPDQISSYERGAAPAELLKWAPTSTGLVAVLGDSRLRHWSGVLCVAFSPDGKLLASGSVDSTIKLWNTNTGEEIRALAASAGWVRSVCFSPDGKWLASGHNNGDLRLWETATGRELKTLKGHLNRVTSVGFSPDGKEVASGSADRSIKVWDAATGQELRTLKGHTQPVNCVIFAPDGEHLLSGSGDRDNESKAVPGEIKIWDARTGKEKGNLPQAEQVMSLSMSRDGRKLASATYDGAMKIWDFPAMTELTTLRGTGVLRCVALSPDGRQIVGAGEGFNASVWEIDAGRVARTLTGHAHWLYAVTFSADGKRIATGCEDGTVKVWDAATGKETLPSKGHSSPVAAVAISPNEQRIASASWDGAIKLWDGATGRETQSLQGTNQRLWCLAFSPDGKLLASGSHDRTVKVWDPVSGGELHTAKGHGRAVLCLAFNPDGTRLASGGEDQTANLWDTATWQVSRSLHAHENYVTAVAFSPDGSRLATASPDYTAKLWDAHTGRELLTLKGHTHQINGLAYSPDGKWIITASTDGTVKIWEAATGMLNVSCAGHSIHPLAVAFSPDGRLAASGGGDGTIRLWDPVTGAARQVFHLGPPGEAPIAQLVFANDGRHILTANGNGTVYILRIARPPVNPATADAEIKQLEGRLSDPKADRERLRQDVIAFRSKYSSSPPHALRAAEIQVKLPSPFDALESNRWPQDCVNAWRTCGREPPSELVAVLGEHRGQIATTIRRAVYSPEGKVLAVGGDDNLVRLWDAATLRPLSHVKGSSPVFTSDGKLWALDGTGVSRWEINSKGDMVEPGNEKVVIKETLAARLLAVSPNGRMLATAGVDHIRVWNLTGATPRELGKILWPPGTVCAICFDGDSKRLIGGSQDKTVKIWDVQGMDAKEIATLTGHGDWVYDVAISPDGKTIASVGAHDRTARIWDVSEKEPKLVAVVPFIEDAGCSVGFSGDGKMLAFGLWNGTVWLVDLKPDGVKHRHVLGGHTRMVWSIAFAPDNKTLATAGEDHTVRLWDVARGKEVEARQGHVGAVWSLALAADGTTLASAGSDRIRLWDARTKKELRTLTDRAGNVRCLAVSPDGTTVAAGDDRDPSIKLWDAASGQELRTLSGHSAGVMALAFSPDGRSLASAGNKDKSVKLWDVESGAERHSFEGHTNVVTAVAFSPDGATLATGGHDSTVRLWNALSGTLLATVSGHVSSALAFSPNGKLLASASYSDSIVRLIDAATGGPISSLSGHTASLTTVAFSPDGKIIASAGFDGTVRLWDSASGTGKQVIVLGDVTGPVRQIAFAADGRHLAVANSNGTIYLLRVGSAPPPPPLSGAVAARQQVDAAKQLGTPVHLTNSIGMKLTLLPAGSFLMGSPTGEAGVCEIAPPGGK